MFERFLYGIFESHAPMGHAVDRLEKAGLLGEAGHAVTALGTYFLPGAGSFLAAGALGEEEMSKAMGGLRPHMAAVRQLAEMARQQGVLLIVKCEDPVRREQARQILKKAKARLITSEPPMDQAVNCRLNRIPLDWLEGGKEGPLYFDSVSFDSRRLRRMGAS